MARAAAGDSSARVRGESAYARSLALSPQNTLALLELARAQLQLRRFDAARDAAQQAADRLPGDALAVATLGHIALVRGDVAAARAAYTRALGLDWHGHEEERATAQAALATLHAP
jgi:predicted negative regulator of RcsB-dependent stress response